jgi:hypothetical protein
MQFPEVMETLEDDANKEREWGIILPIIERGHSINAMISEIKEGAVLTRKPKNQCYYLSSKTWMADKRA